MNNATKIYILDTTKLKDDIIFNKLFSIVSPYRQQKIMKFMFRKDKNLSLGAGLLIDKGLKEYNLHEKDMKYALGKNEKPYFLEYPSLHFNISHSENKVICAFSKEEVGCDIEKVTKINLNIANNFFLKSEYEYIKNQQDSEQAFFRMWTLKESFMKITGLGMSLDLKDFEISFINNDVKISQNVDKQTYYFHEYECDDNYKVSCCNKINDFNEKLIYTSINEFISCF